MPLPVGETAELFPAAHKNSKWAEGASTQNQEVYQDPDSLPAPVVVPSTIIRLHAQS